LGRSRKGNERSSSGGPLKGGKRDSSTICNEGCLDHSSTEISQKGSTTRPKKRPLAQEVKKKGEKKRTQSKKERKISGPAAGTLGKRGVAHG